MRTYPFAAMKGGWFVGAFEPTAFSTTACEVSYKIHTKGEQWPVHYHRVATEVNLLVQGEMTLQGRELSAGTVFVLEPYEVADPTFHSDCHVVCVKVPGVVDDKVVCDAEHKAAPSGPPFAHNPAHPIGTCTECGGEMVYNVPRLGFGAGIVHKATGMSRCGVVVPQAYQHP